MPKDVHFGDNFKPRVLLLDTDNLTETNLYFPALKKLQLRIRDVSEIPRLNKGDQVKITLELTAVESMDWLNHKKTILDYCKDNAIEVHGFTLKKVEKRKRERLNDVIPSSKSKREVFVTFSNREKLAGNIRDVGLSILGE